ncbi:hypothetical protein QZH41_002760 [Actinostola sp. cb2023]|nr:hypothetical protein QZH41_002760 [Actinostola sp. cb2023]
MNNDILECKRKALAMISSEYPPLDDNGKKKGYMKVLKELWDDKGYINLGLKSQNLRDHAARLEKVLGYNLESGKELESAEGTTQGDPLAMGLYALSLQPLITYLQSITKAKQCWFADDASGAGSIEEIKKWWNALNGTGPDLGYFPNGKKCWLIVKPEKEENARDAFKETAINVTTQGQTHLGAVVGSRSYLDEYVSKKIYRMHENEKKRMYSKRVMEIEQGTFTPLVFTTTGGMGNECLRYHSRLAELIAIKKDEKIYKFEIATPSIVSYEVEEDGYFSCRTRHTN